ncbi:MAG: hypothetical protein ACPL7K_01990 [Armatimonadota bacterium]
MSRFKAPAHLRNEKYCVGIIGDSLRSEDNLLRYETDVGREYIAKLAKKHGVNPDAAHYFPQLARYPGDPEAFVSSRSEIRKLAEKRGWEVHGLAEYVPQRDGASREPYRPADDLVELWTERELERHPERDRNEVREEVARKSAGNQDTG